MAIRIGINGFGRIGILAMRAALQRDDVEVAGVNHRSRSVKPTENYAQQLLLNLCFDSVHGRFPIEVEAVKDYFVCQGKKIKATAEGVPADIPWGDLGADIIIESTGVFKDQEGASGHIKGGAKKVIISAPGKGVDATLVMGVNHRQYNAAQHHVVSNASCTTNCLAPVAKVLHENFGIEKALMNTIHAYTNDQLLLDKPYKDPRRARAAALSIVPTTTGAAKAVGIVLPELEGRVNGFAMRVPVPNVSVVDLVADLRQKTTAEEINEAMRAAAANELSGILGFETRPLVSIDYNGDSRSAIVDANSTMVLNDQMARVVAWYDNEWGYVQRLLDLAIYMAEQGLE